MKKKLILSVVLLLVSFITLEAQSYVIVGDFQEQLIGQASVENNYEATISEGIPNYRSVSTSVKVIKDKSISKGNDVPLQSISVFPNPFRETLNLNLCDVNIQEITITDRVGKTVWRSTNIKQTETIDLSEIDNGFYMLNLKCNNKIVTSKIIKKYD